MTPPYPHAAPPSLVWPVLLKGADDGAALGLPGGGVLTAVPGGGVAANRNEIGGWELFQLEPAPAMPPALRALDSVTDAGSLCRAPSTDAGLVASLIADLPADQLGPLMPDIARRADYEWIFPFARTVLSGGAERTRYSTRAHLAAGIAMHGWDVGDHTYGTPTIVDGQYGPLQIGRYCSIAGEVRIVLANHATDTVTTYPFSALCQFWPSSSSAVADHVGRGVTVGNSVWIGAGVTILPGAQIGDGAIVGAQAVVAGVVPPYAVVVGNPARVTRRRFDEPTIARLLALRWWDWPDHKVDRFIPLLLQPDIHAFLQRAEAS